MTFDADLQLVTPTKVEDTIIRDSTETNGRLHKGRERTQASNMLVIFFYILVFTLAIPNHQILAQHIGPFTVLKYLGIICLIASLFEAVRRHHYTPLFKSQVSRWYLIYFLVALISFLVRDGAAAFQSDSFLYTISTFSLFVVTMIMANTINRVRWAVLVALVSIAVGSVYVIRQWQQFHNLYPGFRTFGGLAGDPNYFSVTVVLWAPLTIFWLLSKRPNWEKWLCMGCLGFLGLGFILSASRGGFIGLTVALLFLVWNTRRRVRNLLLVGLLLLPIAFAPGDSALERLLHPNEGDEESSQYRLMLWEAAGQTFREHPLFGVGMGHYRPFVIRDRSVIKLPFHVAHNTYVGLIADLGLAGIVPFLGLFFTTFLNLRRIVRRARESKQFLLHQLALGLQAGLLGYMICAFFLSTLWVQIMWFELFLSISLMRFATKPVAPAMNSNLPAEGQNVTRQKNRGALKKKHPTASIACLMMIVSPIASAQHNVPVSLDRYGGVLIAVAKPSYHFRVTKLGDRWSFVTPEGDAFWMFGVWNITQDGHHFPTSNSPSYDDRMAVKYGDTNLTWGPQQVRRVKSWGFNTIGPYSVSWVSPTQSDSRWPGDKTQPVKLPTVLMSNLSYYALVNSQNFGSRPVKDLIAGVKPNVLGYYGGTFPDIFDPAFDAYVTGALQKDPYFQNSKGSPWVIGYMSGDTDNMWGFGAGPDFATTPAEHSSDHLGVIALITASSQTNNSKLNIGYTDTQVYTKMALEKFLQQKYQTIEALNSAWASSYTTFASAGGWGVGTGLLDESGTLHHKWIGRDTINLRDFNSNIRADLDTFLIELARKYFTICRTRFKQFSPDALYFGITNLGSWMAPPRREILEAAAGLIDVMATNVNPANQQQINFIQTYLGDVPMIQWAGWRANPDSAMFRTPKETDFQTQAERAEAYKRQVGSLWSARAMANGSHPFVGLLWWEFHDNAGESSNWGLVSLLDNAYDGQEAIHAVGHDGWGFTTGGEERDYGDFLSAVRAANQNCFIQLYGEMQRTIANHHN
jgi:putative inorganic carbon (HCO3(-)) transporter